MKLHITNSEKYKSSDMDIPDWFAKEHEFYNQFRSEVEIIRETEKAYNFRLSRSGESHWVPKSICKVFERREKRLFEF